MSCCIVATNARDKVRVGKRKLCSLVSASLKTSGEEGSDESVKARLKVELIVGDRQVQKAMDVMTRYAQVAANRGASHVTLLGVN